MSSTPTSTATAKEWGPSVWSALHSLSFTFTPTEGSKRAFRQFLISLKDVLPCPHCSEHYQNWLKENVIDSDAIFKSRESFAKALVELHNNVRKLQGKSIQKQYVDVKKEYQAFGGGCSIGVGSVGKGKGKGVPLFRKEEEKGALVLLGAIAFGTAISLTGDNG